MNRPSLLDRLRRMNQRSLFGPNARSTAAVRSNVTDADALSSAGQARSEAIQRLQVGVFGIGAMVLLVGLASVIGGQADMNDDLAVPEAAPTTEPNLAPAQANPLADAGVVPDIAAEPSASPEPLLLPTGPSDVPPQR
ncbi:hypothetical protein [Erythrobacter sp. R86502]|uniref:hypothetical protein n=1 Tax=Erythrobacter sp. R86502 TaxID=3093846 RepID=UPI0036D4404F